MVVELRRAGFSLGELAELPPASWRELYAACRSRYYSGMSELVAVAHPDKPGSVQASFRKMADSLWGSPEVPIWADPERFRAMLGTTKVIAKKVGEA